MFALPKAWAYNALQLTPNTPDIAQLEQHAWQLLFVWNRWLPNHTKHLKFMFELPEDKPIWRGWAFTVDSDFEMYEKDLGIESYPIVLRREYKPKEFGVSSKRTTSRIKGGLYAVRPSQFRKHLDIEMENTVQFYRKRVRLVQPYTHVSWDPNHGLPVVKIPTTYIIEAWMYIGIDEYWDPLIDNGYLYQPVSRYTLNENPKKGQLGEYIFYSLEYMR